MKFVVVFTYMDGEELEIEVVPEDMDKFMNSLGSAEVYFDAAKGHGLWVPIDKIRYFHVERQDEHGVRVVEPNIGLPRPTGEIEGNKKGIGESGVSGLGEPVFPSSLSAGSGG